jgi:uncharacterized protein with von Willebrand factor type A (vWA) domain
MNEFVYRRWDGTQRLEAFDADELLGSMADDLLAGEDFEDVLARIMRWGHPDRLEGLQELLERLREARRRALERHNLSGIIDDIQRKLDDVKHTERAGIKERRARPTPDAQLREAFERLAAQREAELDALPEDPGGQIRELQAYDFVEPRAREKFQALLGELQEQVMRSYFAGMQQALSGVSKEQIERLREMVRDLDRALRERMAGGEPDFEAFQRKYPELAGSATNWDDLLRQMARSMAAMRSLMQSMTPEMREQLEQMMSAAFGDPDLQRSLDELSETLSQLFPMESLTRPMRFSGDQPVTLAEALELMGRMQELSQVERAVQAAQDPRDLDDIDPERVEQLAGPEARAALDQLRGLTRLLRDAGYIKQERGRFQLTARGIRKIGQRSLEEIFATLKRDAFGKHRARFRGRGGDPTDETKRYEFGDAFLLDLPSTVRAGVLRGGTGTPVQLQEEDFAVYRTEYMTQSATVLMVDVSRSMLFRGCFLAAKKVALALDSLIRGMSPKDDLFIVGFSAVASELKAEELPRLTWNEYVYGTNMQDGFALSRQLLSRSGGKNKQVILITDGEPTAHFEEGEARPRFSYPPTRRTFEATLREVVRCTREGIVINTFMLARGHYLVDFVNQMSKINHGRAFFVTPDRLGEYVLIDYVSNKRRRIA